MATVEQAAGVYRAINLIQAALAKEGISKERTNREQGYQFRGIDDVYNALSPLLAQHSLCILPRVLERECSERATRSGGTAYAVWVRVEFDFICSTDGSRHTVSTFGEAMDTGDKATNKAISQAYKNCALQAFAIPTEGDNDPDAHTHEVVNPAQQQERSSQQQQRQTQQSNRTQQQRPAQSQAPAQTQKPAAASPAPNSARAALKPIAEDISRLAASMGFTVKDVSDVITNVHKAKELAELPMQTVTEIKTDLANKAALWVQIRDQVRRIYFDREAFDSSVQKDKDALRAKLADVLANKASLSFASKPLRAPHAEWRQWLDELRSTVPA